MRRFLVSGAIITLLLGTVWILLFGMPHVLQGSENAQDAAEKVTPSLTAALEEQDLKFGSPVFLRAFKEERELELWVQEPEKKTFKLFRTYPIAGSSGKLGPKLAEGDFQVPEGFYFVPPRMMNPNSQFHLAFNIGFPNAYDRAHDRTGSFIMVHGSTFSSGCLAMTDEKIEEIYTLCDAAHQKEQEFFRIHLFPFRMTSEKMATVQDHEWIDFWKNLEEGYRSFEEKKVPPNVTVKDKRYVFADAQ